MALLWIEGFETFGAVVETQVAPQLIRKYAPPINCTSVCRLVAGRHFGNAIRMQATNPPQTFATPPFSPVDTVVVGFALKVSSISTTTDLVRLHDGESVYHLGLEVCNSGAIRINRAGTILPGESSPNIIAADSWYYVEFLATIHESSGSYEVRVNGVTVASASGIDTRNGGTGLIDRVQLRTWTTGAAYMVYYDDIYVLNTSGPDNTTFLGSQIVEAVFPVDEVQDEWTPSAGTNNALLVNENPANGDGSYVSSDSVGNKDLYSVGGLVHVLGDIKGVQLNVDARVTDVNPLKLRPILKSGDTETPLQERDVTTTGYKVVTLLAERNPDTDQAWTPAEVSTLHCGIEHVT